MSNLESASSVTEILSAVARAVWAKEHNDADCPTDSIPTSTDLLHWVLRMSPADRVRLADEATPSRIALIGPAETGTEPATMREDAITLVPLAGDGDFRAVQIGPVEISDNMQAGAHLVAVAEAVYQVHTITDILDAPARDLMRRDAATWFPDAIHRLHAEWCAAKQATDAGDALPRHPLAPIVRAWQEWKAAQPVGPHDRHLIVTGIMQERSGMPHRPLVRTPALFDVALMAVEVDGEPFATPMPRETALQQRFRRRRAPEQGELWPAPRTLDSGHADPILRMAAGMTLTGDERSTLRGDVIAVARIVYALTGAIRVPPDWGAILLGSKDTAANRERWYRATRALRWADVTINERTGEWRNLAVVDIADNGDVAIGPPLWWSEQTGPSRYRLTAGLLRPTLIREAAQGTGEGYWSSLARTVDGIEALLSYGPSAGRGRGGRTPDLLRPADGRKTGPGPDAFIPWRNVLHAAGEHVEPDADPKGRHGVRYRNRINALQSAGYLAGNRGTAATAGDSVEIVRVIKGGKGRPGGLLVRASARFTEAIKKGERVRIPASSAFPGAFTGSAGNREPEG